MKLSVFWSPDKSALSASVSACFLGTYCWLKQFLCILFTTILAILVIRKAGTGWDQATHDYVFQTAKFIALTIYSGFS